MTDVDLLRKAAQRAAQNPFFLAAPVMRVAEADGLSDAELAERLGCSEANLLAVLLCRRPDGDPAAFRADLARIAQRFGADPFLLAEAIRMGDSLAALAARGGVEQDLLAAARDRETDEEETL